MTLKGRGRREGRGEEGEEGKRGKGGGGVTEEEGGVSVCMVDKWQYTITSLPCTSVWKQECRLTRNGWRSVLAVVKILFSDMRLSTSSRLMMSAFFNTYTAPGITHKYTD